MNVNIKGINDVNKLLLMRDEIKEKIKELNEKDDDTIKQLKKNYMNISNKINYINNREEILEKYKDYNRQYVKNNYEVVKERNRQYQTKRRQKFKQFEEFFNNSKKNE
jgi:hypothetical protein